MVDPARDRQSREHCLVPSLGLLGRCWCDAIDELVAEQVSSLGDRGSVIGLLQRHHVSVDRAQQLGDFSPAPAAP